MNREVLLVRHAETAWTGIRFCGTSDPPLSDLGRLAADRLAESVAGTVPRGTVIVSSPSRRAIETASRIGEGIGAPVAIDSRWREVDFGAAEGLTFEEVAERWPAHAARLLEGETSIDWPEGEREADLGARVEAALRGLPPSPCAIVVSHAGPIRLAIAITLGIAPERIPPLAPGGLRWLPFRAGVDSAGSRQRGPTAIPP
jgi:broad specificity phosphatase PhoE